MTRLTCDQIRAASASLLITAYEFVTASSRPVRPCPPPDTLDLVKPRFEASAINWAHSLAVKSGAENTCLPWCSVTSSPAIAFSCMVPQTFAKADLVSLCTNSNEKYARSQGDMII